MKPGYWIPVTMVGLFVGTAAYVGGDSPTKAAEKPQAAEAPKLPEKRIFVFKNGEGERLSDAEGRTYIMLDAQTGKQYMGVPNMGMIDITPEKKKEEQR